MRAAVDLPPFPQLGDGRLRRAGGGHAGPAPRGAAGLRPGGRRRVRSEPGEAIGIATGGAVPEGADAVVPIELVVESDNSIEVGEAARDAHIRPVGGDVGRGDRILEAGIDPRSERGSGRPRRPGSRCSPAPVGRGPLCSSTGTELRPPGETLAPGEIYESNSTLLAAALAGAGAEVETLAPVADDMDAHRAALERGLAADVFVSSGGVSVGPHDLVRATAAGLGVEEVFWRVAVKPGKPVAFGVRDRTLVFGLPGNPVSALVGFELFVRPAVRALQGAEPGPAYRSVDSPAALEGTSIATSSRARVRGWTTARSCSTPWRARSRT